jgi:uracil-DNA glycosylase family 4
MPSSAIVDDTVRRWLEVQRDLGGDDVWFASPLTPANSGRRVANSEQRTANAEGPSGGQPGAEGVVEGEPFAVRRSPSAVYRLREYPAGHEPAWRKDAPALPGPGMEVTSPPPGPREAAWSSLDAIAAEVVGCTRCPLCRGRTNAVPGEGNSRAELLVVGEGPGEQEDLTGRPFVGRAGELLDKILGSIEVPRETAYIANVVKCRPPRNRAPLPDERAACLPYLHRQVELVRPRVMLALGTTAAEALLGVKRPLGELRLKVHRFNGIPLVVTYHPAALLRNPNWKRPAWDDVRIARLLLDRLD